MNGTNAADGTRLDGIDHLRQSIRDILTTPLGTRVMRRDYGSRLPALVDAPLNRGTILQLYAATAEALKKWEPRFQLSAIKAATSDGSGVTLDLTGIYKPDGQEITLDGIKVN